MPATSTLIIRSGATRTTTKMESFWWTGRLTKKQSMRGLSSPAPTAEDTTQICVCNPLQVARTVLPAFPNSQHCSFVHRIKLRVPDLDRILQKQTGNYTRNDWTTELGSWLLLLRTMKDSLSCLSPQQRRPYHVDIARNTFPAGTNKRQAVPRAVGERGLGDGKRATKVT